jgi:hypothetical protein
VIERFTAAGVPKGQIPFQRDTYTLESDGSPTELVTDFRDDCGPTMNAFAAAAADGREAELHAELQALLNEQNTNDTGRSIPATFLRVSAKR